MPGPSSPDGVAIRVSRAPSCPASTFSLFSVVCMPPICMASACAASLPEYISSPCNRSLME